MMKDRIFIEQIRFLYSNANFVFSGVVLISMFIGIMLWSTQSHYIVLSWVLANWLLTLLRWLGVKAYDRQQISTNEQAGWWGRAYAASGFLSGCLWGALPILFLDFSSTYNVTAIMVVLLAMISGSVSSQSAYPVAFFCFVIPEGAPIVFLLANEGGYFTYLSIMFVIYALLNAALSKKYYHLILLTIKQQFDNLNLLHDLGVKKNEAETANMEKTRFLASASHDLRQPLQAQRMFAEAIRNQTKETTLQEISQKLIDSQFAMQSMLDSLLDISRLDAGMVKPVMIPCSLHQLFDSIVSDIYPLAEQKGLGLHVHWPSDDAIIYSDQGLLESILRNLANNAVRYTDKGSIMIAARRRENHWCLEVRDSGIGIAENMQQDVFHEFFQLGNPERDCEKGLGLGLSIVQKLCHLLHYELQLRSKPEAGSTFSILVPLSQENIPDIPLSHVEGFGEHGVDMDILSRLEILMIDDDKAVRESIRDMLMSIGLHARVAGHIDTAIAMTVEKTPDVIIVDYRLRNHKTGVEAIEGIRAAAEVNIPAILLTGDTSPQKLLELFQTGHPVLHKPISQQMLLMTIQEVVTKQQEHC